MEKIAVIGLSCLFPDAQNPEQFWQNLSIGKNSISSATDQQMGFDPEVFYDPIKGNTGEKGKYYCKRGGFIRDFQFNAADYQISPEVLLSLDPIYQWSIYVAKQALQDSGYLGQAATRNRTGVILGNLSSPTRSSYHLVAPIYRKTVESAMQELLHRYLARFKINGDFCDP
ncbi:MAG: hypothetical protein HC936_07315 [Leptolyngbyaceae cyanobacterium SU_3_3]|nr:hypothetical protein [Leptolyngbyaceae cyanobacterium SU_3_3]